MPECAALIPAGAEPCERDGAWERCPMYVPAAMRCELRVLHRELTLHRDELVALTASHQAAERAVHEQRASGRWAWRLGAGGVAIAATGLALLVDGQLGLGAGLAAGGVVTAGIGALLVW